MNPEFISQMQFAFFDKHVTIVDISDIGINHFGNSSDLFLFTIDEDRFAWTTILFCTDIEVFI